MTILMVNGLMLSACKPDLAVSPGQDLDASLWSLALNHHAVLLSTVAPYDTVQLVAIPHNAYGVELQDLPPVTYTTTDTTIRLSATGRVTASSQTRGTSARVVASINSGQSTQADTVYIQISGPTVTASQPRTFTVIRTDVDSLTAAIGFQYIPTPVDTLGGFMAAFVYPAPMFGVRVTAEDGSTIQPPVYFRISDPTIGTINRTTGAVTMSRPGAVKVYTTAYIYGKSMQDSTPFTITSPLFTAFTVGLDGTWVYSARVRVGAVIDWTNYGKSAVDVLFDDSRAASGIQYGSMVSDSGDIRGLAQDKHARRQFNTPGVYPFRISTQPPITGSITVVNE